MRIRTYFFNSFVVHAVFLIYLFSLPLQRTIIQSGSYNAYFVSLQSEGKKTANMSSARGTKKLEVHGKVKDKETRPETREPVVSKVNESPEEATPVKKPDDKAREQVEEKPVAEVKEPDEFQQVTEAQREVHALEEKKQEKPKNEVPETKKNETTIAIKEAAAPMPPSPYLSKVDKTSFIEKQGITILPHEEKPLEKSIDVSKLEMNKETEKRLEPEKKEALQEKVTPKTEVKEKTAMPQKIEEPLKEIPEGEKPDTKESQRIEAVQNTKADVSEDNKSSLIEKTPTQERVSSPQVQKTTGSREGEKISKAESLSDQNKVVRAAHEKGMSGTTAKGKTKIGKATSLGDRPDKNHVSPQGLKDAASFGKVQGEPTIQGSTREQTKQSSQEGSSPAQDEGNEQPVIQAKQEGQGNTVAEGKKSLVAIPVSEVLVPCDLKIEVALRKPSAFHSEPVIQKAPQVEATTGQSNMPKATEITQISLEEVVDRIKVHIKANGSMRPKVFTLDKNRIVVDIPNVVMNSQLPSNLAPPLKDMRSGKHKDKSRLVLELNEKMPFDVSSAGDTFIVSVQKPGSKPHPIPGEQEAQEKIEAKELEETEISNITMHLLKNPHPKSDQREKQNEVTLLEGVREAQHGDKSTVKRAFSVLRTAEGAYTFLVRNEENEPYETDLVFFIFQGKPGERTKKFAAVRLSPHTSVRFKFLLPDAIFWNDEDYFSGKIENSETMTKFNEKTGIVWKETKDE